MTTENTQEDNYAKLGKAFNDALLANNDKQSMAAREAIAKMYTKKEQTEPNFVELGEDIKNGNIHEAIDGYDAETKQRIYYAIDIANAPEATKKEVTQSNEGINTIEHPNALNLDQTMRDKLAQMRHQDAMVANEELVRDLTSSINITESKQGAQDENEKLIEKNKQAEYIKSMQQDVINAMNMDKKSGRELEHGEFLRPLELTRNYSEIDGKYYAKDDKNRLMFEDKGTKISTATTDKDAIASMVTLAKAKQWETLKLSGSQEFRREAWLQAESQGIKTKGYTPRSEDLAALQSLTEIRSTNVITPLQERKAQNSHEQVAPRHDLNKNQAVLHNEATKNMTDNMKTLKGIVAGNLSQEDLGKLAYLRGLVQAENKHLPPDHKDDALRRFDAEAKKPDFIKQIKGENEATIDDKTKYKEIKLDMHEHTH